MSVCERVDDSSSATVNLNITLEIRLQRYLLTAANRETFAMRNLRLEPENVQVAGTRDEEYRVEMTGYANWGSPSLWPEKIPPEDEEGEKNEGTPDGAHSSFEHLPPVDFFKLVGIKFKFQDC